VVVSIDSLACLDYLIWLCSGSAAAARLGLTQPTVSRNVSRVSEIFAIELVKPNGEWELNGDTTLLNLERSVHQRYRWFRQLPLRIEAQYYSGPLFCDGLLSGWHVGNFDFLEVHTDVAPGNQSTVNESPHPARLGRGLHHETNPPHTRADHQKAQDR
jgi:hypothetical protein